MGALDRKDFELELPESWPEDVRRVVEDGRDAAVAYHHERQRIDRLGCIVLCVVIGVGY